LVFTIFEQMNIYSILAVGIGGMIGSVGRYLLSRSVDARLPSAFPYGTLTVNLLGSLALGLIYGLALRKTPSAEPWTLFFATGVCGGFTTFSTFAFENFMLMHNRPGIAAIYILASILGGVFAVGIGYFGARAF
jgi:fluoride exporter